MKRNLNNFMAVAVVASVFVACAKETEHTAPTIKPSADSKGIEINVVALETKTAVVDGTTPSVKWLSTDAVKVFEIVDDAVFGNATSSETTLSDGDAIASFKATLPGEPSAGDHTYKYTSVYPASAVKEDGGHYYLEVPATQNLVDGNFATDADVLISSVVNKGSTRVTASENVGFAFGRLGTVVKLTLKGITPGEKIQRVVITAPVDIAGSIQYDPITGTVDTNTLYDDESSDTITLNVDNLVATGTDVLWFRVLSQSWDEGDEFSVVVTTNKAKYYRDEWGNWDKITIPTGGFAFADGGLTKLGINLANYRVAHYVAAVAGDIVDGATFVVGSTKANGDFVAMGEFDSDNYYYKYVDAQGGEGYIDVPTKTVRTVTLESAGEGKFYLKDSDDNYLYAANSNNLYGDAGTSNDNYKWTVAIAAITNVGQSTRKIQYNSASPRFAAYTSSQRAIKLYKLDGPSVSGSAVSFDSAVSATKSSTLTPINLTNISERSWTDKPAWVTVTFDGNTMNVTATDNKTLEARDGVIRVSVTGEEGTAGCDVAVSQPASVFTASSTADMNFVWDDSDVKSTTITSTFELSDLHITVTGDGKDEFLVTITRVGSSDDYTLEVMPLGENESGANYEAVVSISRDELTPISINVMQAYKGGGSTPLTAPSGINFTNISIGTKNFSGSWNAVANADSYDWIVSTSSSAPANTNDASVKAFGNTASTSFDEDVATEPEANTVYYLYVKSKGSGVYSDSDFDSANAILYLHSFTAKPSTGSNIILSGISWTVSATNLGNYNSGNYAGVQFGSSKNTGSISLTSSNAWGGQTSTNYYQKTIVKKMVLWLNTGGSNGQVTATATIGGTTATPSGTVVKNSSAGTNWKAASPMTFTPANDGKIGVVSITATTGSNKCAGYICALEILSEPSTE